MILQKTDNLLNYVPTIIQKILGFIRDILIVSVIGIGVASDDFFLWLITSIIPISLVGNGIRIKVQKHILGGSTHLGAHFFIVTAVSLIILPVWLTTFSYFFNIPTALTETSNLIYISIYFMLIFYQRFFQGIIQGLKLYKTSLSLPSFGIVLFIILLVTFRESEFLYIAICLAAFLEVVTLLFIIKSKGIFLLKRSENIDFIDYNITLVFLSVSALLPSLYPAISQSLIHTLKDGQLTVFLLAIKIPTTIATLIISVLTMTIFNESFISKNKHQYLANRLSVYFFITSAASLLVFFLSTYIVDVYSFFIEFNNNIAIEIIEYLKVLSFIIPFQVCSIIVWRFIAANIDERKIYLFSNAAGAVQILTFFLLFSYTSLDLAYVALFAFMANFLAYIINYHIFIKKILSSSIN